MSISGLVIRYFQQPIGSPQQNRF